MCLIALAWQAHPDYPLVVMANRDEFYRRPTTPARFWPEAPRLLAGRDLAAGGTWLGVTRQGRFAALTNYRDPEAPAGERSRGLLVSSFLQGQDSAWDYAMQVAAEGPHYGGFNLLLGDGQALVVVSNRGTAPTRLSPGVHGLSNHLLDTPWPKVKKAKAGLEQALPALESEHLLALLRNDSQADDDALPDTGVGLAMERMLSPLFIASPQYGTRASTVLLLGRERVLFVEQTFDGDGAGERSQFSFDLQQG
ncbi:MAG: NRDE family protein [Moraxellaceae bacterium]